MSVKARCAPGEVGVGLRIACVVLLPFLNNNSISKVEKAKYTVQSLKEAHYSRSDPRKTFLPWVKPCFLRMQDTKMQVFLDYS
jgi:hypothetical protein